jgi:hypothetical protein
MATNIEHYSIRATTTATATTTTTAAFSETRQDLPSIKKSFVHL